MTISYPIETFEAEDDEIIHLNWNSDCTWSIEKYEKDAKFHNYPGPSFRIRDIPEDFDNILKGKEFEFNSGMFGWLYTIKSSIVDDRLNIEEWIQMWSDKPAQLGGIMDITIADFEKCREIANKKGHVKPVHYCNPDGSIVLDPKSFEENDEEGT